MTTHPGVLTTDGILDAAEDVLRRYGPAKTNVVDVAKVLGVSHGSVYRHFPSKIALRDAVAERWLARLSAPLAAVADEQDGPAVERLLRWIRQLAATKQRMSREDPELFATFHRLTTEARDVVSAHVGHLAAQISHIIATGIDSGEFAAVDPSSAGCAVLQATAFFHHPAHAEDWDNPAVDQELDAVCRVLVAGLATR